MGSVSLAISRAAREAGATIMTEAEVSLWKLITLFYLPNQKPDLQTIFFFLL